jgi:hypothetical protein
MLADRSPSTGILQCAIKLLLIWQVEDDKLILSFADLKELAKDWKRCPDVIPEVIWGQEAVKDEKGTFNIVGVEYRKAQNL